MSSVFFCSNLNFTLITVDNILYHCQYVSSKRNETLTVTCSQSAETVEFRDGFKMLRLVLRFLIFSSWYRVNATPLTVRISFRFETLPASSERGRGSECFKIACIVSHFASDRTRSNFNTSHQVCMHCLSHRITP